MSKIGEQFAKLSHRGATRSDVQPDGEAVESVEALDKEEGETEETASVATEKEEATEEKEEGHKTLEERMAEFRREMKEEVLGSSSPQQPTQTDSAEEEAVEPETFTWVNSDEEAEDITGTAEGLNKLLNGVYDKAFNAAMKIATDLKAEVPQMTSKQVQAEIAIQNATREFVEKNPDVAKYPRTVQKVINQIESAHPDWSVAQILTESAKEVRRELDLPESEAKAEESDPELAAEKERAKKENPKPPGPSLKASSSTRRVARGQEKEDKNSVGSQFQRMRAGARGQL